MNFSKGWIEEGLHDRAITRDLDWGVSVPVAGIGEGKKIYVWFEAVIGYLSAAKEWAKNKGVEDAWEKWWCNPNSRSVYFIGKDNIPFHTIIWPAMLIGYGDLNLPTDVPANQYVTFKGGKASASRGIGLTISESLEVFEADSLRYALAASFPEQSDTELTVEEICRRINEELVATWGNLVNRVLSMIYNSCEATIPSGELRTEEDLKLLSTIDQIIERAGQEIDNVELRSALQTGMSGAAEINAYLNSSQNHFLRKWTLTYWI